MPLSALEEIRTVEGTVMEGATRGDIIMDRFLDTLDKPVA